jgi:hypothetical protein
MIPNGYFVAISHKNLKDTFVIRKQKLEHFFKVNERVWEKYKIKTKDFIVKDVWMKDKLVDEVIVDAFPEDFL